MNWMVFEHNPFCLLKSWCYRRLCLTWQLDLSWNALPLTNGLGKEVALPRSLSYTD